MKRTSLCAAISLRWAERYAQKTLPEPLVAFVEAHLMSCESCLAIAEFEREISTITHITSMRLSTSFH
jgi:hypothetical protein